jgi:hypothetical protein
MRPLRKVLTVAHVMAYHLACGHTIYRRPLTGKHAIPQRAQCSQCEADRLAEHVRKLLDFCKTKPETP